MMAEACVWLFRLMPRGMHAVIKFRVPRAASYGASCYLDLRHFGYDIMFLGE